MQGMSERQYAAHVGLSRGAIQKAKTAERLVLYPDGSINAAASDARRAETTDPSKTRKPPEPKSGKNWTYNWPCSGNCRKMLSDKHCVFCRDIINSVI